MRYAAFEKLEIIRTIETSQANSLALSEVTPMDSMEAASFTAERRSPSGHGTHRRLWPTTRSSKHCYGAMAYI